MQSGKAISPPADDRRRAARTPAVFAVKESTRGGIQLCQAEDINPAGMTIRRPRDLLQEPRTSVALEFDLPGGPHEIATEAVVIHDAPEGPFRRTGVRFVGLPSELQQAIVAFCDLGSEATG